MSPPARAASSLHPADGLIWGLIAAVAALVLLAPLVSDFRLVWSSFAAPLGAGAALLGGAYVYARWRPDPRLSTALNSTAQVVVFAAFGAPLSYLAAALGGAWPLQDRLFDALDHALGLDWLALLDLMNAHPAAYAALGLAYGSLTLQMAAAALCLAFTGRFAAVRVYTLAFVLTALVTIALSIVVPAAGVWPHLGLGAAQSPHLTPAVAESWPVFYGLREGSYRLLMATGAQGIVTFPSLHAALAVVLMVSLWPVARLRWIVLALDLAMLAATPIDGSHYFVDLIAGIAVAGVCLAAARRLAKPAGEDRFLGPVATVRSPRFAAGE